MEPLEIENLLNMFTVLFVVLVVMMTMNQFGVNMMTIVFAFIMLSGILLTDSSGAGGAVANIGAALANIGAGAAAAAPAAPAGGGGPEAFTLNADQAMGSRTGGLIGMSLLDLDQYYNSQTKAIQFPGWNKSRDIPGHIADILVRVIVTMVLLTYFVKSGIFRLENLNPMKMYYM